MCACKVIYKECSIHVLFYSFTDNVHSTQQGRVEMDNPAGQTQQPKGKDNVHISSSVVYSCGQCLDNGVTADG